MSIQMLETQLRKKIGQFVKIDCRSNIVAYSKYMSAFPRDYRAIEYISQINNSDCYSEKEKLLSEFLAYLERK